MKIYIDESGSINTTDAKLNKYFIICLLIPKDEKRLKKVYKSFISSNLKTLKTLDKKNKMFDAQGNFLELKGSSLNKEMKLKFLNYFCKNNLFEVRYIVLENQNCKPKIAQNKARTFNYLLKLSIENCFHKKLFNEKTIYLDIDERNVKTDSKYSLEDYLYTSLGLEMDLIDNVFVHYYDSSQNPLIQIADVFSNIKYSNIITEGAYNDILKNLEKQKYILPDFVFPYKKGIFNCIRSYNNTEH